MENTGIDYGNGLTNIDLKTGIRYGVISIHEVTQAWCDESEAHYGPIDCPLCGKDFDLDSNHDCPHCEADSADLEGFEPISLIYDKDGYKATQGSEDTDIWIFESPYFTYAQFCSPCAPGAGYIMNTVEENTNNKAYCFGHDWFEGEKAPYPVYDVKTGKEVEAK